jgi:hypothetical protein
MSPTPDAPGDAEPSDADLRWLDRLTATTHVSPPQDSAEAEADALRRALQRERAAAAASPEAAAATSPAERQRRWERLQFRLRREGLAARRPTWRTRWLPVSAALAAGIVAFLVLRPDFDETGGNYDEPPVARGEIHAAVVVNDHPRRTMESSAAALRAVGLRPRLYREGTTYVLDVDVAAETAPDALDALRRIGLEPRIGLNRLSIERPPK